MQTQSGPGFTVVQVADAGGNQLLCLGAVLFGGGALGV
jgi:hypothetical protein